LRPPERKESQQHLIEYKERRLKKPASVKKGGRTFSNGEQRVNGRKRLGKEVHFGRAQKQ